MGCQLFFRWFLYGWQQIEKNGGVELSDFKEGEYGKVTGRVVFAGRVLTAPLSGRSCTYYHVMVELNMGGKNSQWVEIINEEKAGDVILKSGNDYVLVDTKLVQAYLVKDFQHHSGFLNDANPQLEKYLKQHQTRSIGLFGFNRELRFNEGILGKNEFVAVSGKGSWKKAKTLKINVPAERVLHLYKDGEEPVYLSDDPRIT